MCKYYVAILQKSRQRGSIINGNASLDASSYPHRYKAVE